ncbi:Clr5 domain-containing protein [Apiospora arundinis]
MAPAIIYANQPKDFSLWDAHKDILKQLYLTEKKPLKEVQRLMESDYGFPSDITLSTYETTLRKHLGFRKNLKRTDWEEIGTNLDKRQGKETEVIFRGDRLTGKRVAKEVDRYHPKTKRYATPAHATQLRSEIVIRTPSPALPEIIPDVQPSASTVRLVPTSEHANAINNLVVTPTGEIAQRFLQFPSVYHPQIGFLLQGHFAQARKHLPINEFADKLVENILILHRRRVSKDMLRSLSDLVQMTGFPTTFGLNTSVEILLHAGYMLSNGYTCWDQSDEFRTWIEKVADIQLLVEFFSQNTPTSTAAWLNLSRMKNSPLSSYDTFAEIWFRVGMTASDNKWLLDNPSRCEYVLLGMSPARGWKLFKGIWQSRKMHGSLLETYRTGILAGKLWGMINDPVLTKDVIDLGIPLPQMAFTKFRLPPRDDISGLQSQCLKMLADAGVGFMSEGAHDINPLLFWLPNSPVRTLEKAWLTVLDQTLGIFDALGGSLKDCVTVCGICAAAARGVECLREYARAKPHQASAENSPHVSLTKEELLQVALSKTVKMGLQSIVEVLLQFGAESSVNILGDSKLEYLYSAIYHPVVEAVHALDVGMIRLLAKYGADFDHQEVLDAVLDCKRERSEGMGLAVNCETLVDTLSEVGLCLQKHGPITMLKATGVLETQRYGSGFSLCMFNKDLINALRRHDVAWDDTYFNNGKLWKSWGWGDGEVGGMDLLHATVRRGNRFNSIQCLLFEGISIHINSIQCLLDEGISIHSRPCDLDGKSILHAALECYSADRVKVVMLLLNRMGAEREADPVWPRLLELSIPTP